MRLYPIDDPEHSDVADLLPWYVNSTLDLQECTRVERHLADCIACKQDLLALRNVQAIYAAEAHDQAASHGLARVRARIEGSRPDRHPATRDRLFTRHKPRWWQTLLIAQAAVIVVLVAAFVPRSEPLYYHTLGAARPPAARGAELIVVFDAERSEGQIREALRALHARIVDGPTPEGAYTLEVPAAERAQALAQLRQRAWVRFAEPAATAGTP
jgi:anti-sigma-K factor RskA